MEAKIENIVLINSANKNAITVMRNILLCLDILNDSKNSTSDINNTSPKLSSSNAYLIPSIDIRILFIILINKIHSLF